MDTIISKSNEKVKFIKSLNEKKFRQKYNAFYLEGIKVVEEVLKSKKAIDILFIAYSDTILEKLNGGKSLLEKLKTQNSIETINLGENIFEYVTDTISPQGILAVLKIPKYDLIEELKKNKKNILILDKIQDSGNLGTIIRTADAFDVGLILCINGTTDMYSPKVVRSTMGSIFRLTVIYISQEDIDRVKEQGYYLIGTDVLATKSVKEINLKNKNAFVLGNEANGVSEKLKKQCDDNIKIKMEKTAESLNVGIAAGIILYEQYDK